MISLPSEDNKENKVLYINFNQDNSCFCVGTEEGFLICATSPFKILLSRSNKI